MTRPPVFGARKADRWSLGSEVVAFWWVRGQDGSMTEHTGVGVVAGIRAGGPDGWLVTISWGAMLDLVRPTTFNPSDLTRAAPYDPTV